MSAPPECPEIECWQTLLNDTAPPDVREQFERHIESCPVCQKRIDQNEESVHALLQMVRQVGDPTIAPNDPTLAETVRRLHELNSPLPTSTEPADLSFLSPGNRPGILGMLGAYEVEEVIGQGGMGIVLKAFDPALHRLVAIKVMSAAVASGRARQRFTREAKAAASVCHEHVVTVHGVFATNGLPYLVMQYVEGESVQARLDRSGPLVAKDIVRIGLQTASGLAAAHAQGLIHRDIKPANLLLENGVARVRITDFGLARMTDDVHLTQSGVLAGTPEYMAPEQARGEEIDRRADLFSLGSVLYALCTGIPPFRGSTAVAVLRQVSDQEPTAIQALNPDIPPWLTAFIARLMAKEPADRFQSAGEVLELLEQYLAHLRQPGANAAPEFPFCSLAVSARKPAMEPRMTTQNRVFAMVGLAILSCLFAFGFRAILFKQNPTVAAQSIGPSTLSSNEPQLVAPKDGMLCLLVNKNSGRCLSTWQGSATPGSKIVQGPMPDQAGDNERWRLVEAGKAFRLRNQGSHLFLEIGSANQHSGVQAIQWNDQSGATHQQWTIEPVGDGYILRVAHSKMVLSIGEGSLAPGGRAVQWDYLPDVPEEVWELWSADRLAAAQPGPLSETSRTSPASRSGVLVALESLVLGTAVALLSGLGVWLYVRHNRRAAQSASVAAPEQSATVAEPVSFACSTCGKKLRAKAELAGKKVKCPQCGAEALIPSAS